MRTATIENKVTVKLRKELARDWGLPMDRYSTSVATDTTYRRDTGTVDLCVTFTHHITGATIVVENIIASDAGEILEQYPPKLEFPP